jgi:predicted transcriptional regulator
MAVHLTTEQEERLTKLAAETGMTGEELGQQVVERYIRHIDTLIADVREGEESAEHEGWLTHDEVFENLHKRLLKTA